HAAPSLSPFPYTTLFRSSHRHGPRMMSVALLDGSVSVWDAFVAAAPGSTFCHLAGWRDVMTDVLGHQCFYTIACDDAGVWRGILDRKSTRLNSSHGSISY